MGLVNKNVWIDEPEDGITYFKFLRRVSAKHSLHSQSRRKTRIKRIFEIGYVLKGEISAKPLCFSRVKEFFSER